jgi:MoaA/NifB/PqqE/SkfB family radical SAM enzyme
LACSYCRISGDIQYVTKPLEYPDRKWYLENERNSEWWLSAVRKLYAHNKDMFFILYGGEPFLRWELLADIVNLMNDLDANYTIISSCNEGIKKSIYRFFERVHHVTGFTASVDPGFFKYNETDRKKIGDDEIYKSQTGLSTLLELMEKGLVADPVAEITADAKTVFDLEETVKILDGYGIVSDITAIDLAYNNYYDFSSITNPEHLIPKSPEIRAIFDRLKASDYKIHMKDILLDKTFDVLPANLKCGIGSSQFSNITIEPSGHLRLCLRIRGRKTVDFSLDDLLTDDGLLTAKFDSIREAFDQDYETLCRNCNWTCMLMSMEDNCERVAEH